MTPGNPLSLLNVEDPRSSVGRNAEPMGLLDKNLLVYAVRRGGMGEVFLCGTAEEARRGPSLALKTFQKRFFFDRAIREGFIRECAIWSRLFGIPHIMIVFDIRMIDHRPFVVMPAILSDCASVADLLKAGEITPVHALHLAWQAAFAMKAGQERLSGLVHGDLKPDNLLLYHDAVFVSDFGLARVLTQQDGSAPLEGTWAYRAPEVWKDAETLSVSSDIYAFGVLLYEMVAGRLPFEASSAASWKEAHSVIQPAPLRDAKYGELGAELGKLAIHCMQKKPQDRPRSFQVIWDVLSEMGKNHDVIDQFMLLVETARWKDTLAEMKNNFQLTLIRSLATIGLPELALELLDDYPEEGIVGEVATLKGTILSLNGRDEEAISAFDLAIRGELTPEQLTQCMTEKGLSLKRLGRNSEAITLYETLLDKASDRFAPGLVVNFATALSAAKEFERAKDLLKNFVRKIPDIPAAWGNLGIAYEGLNDDTNAIEAYRKAIRLDPSLANVQVMLAEVLLRSGHVQEASLLLDAAYDQGYQSERWITNAIAVNGLLGEADIVETLLEAVKRDLGSESCDRIEKQAMDMLKQGATKMIELSNKQAKK